MEANRLELREKLNAVMTACGKEPHLYFQPPESIKLEYPCFIYRLKNLGSRYADNCPYYRTVAFDVTYITRSPTDPIKETLLGEPTFAFDRYYTANNLHHYSYTYATPLKEV